MVIDQMIRHWNMEGLVTHIFVQNYEQKLERDFSRLVFGKEPLRIIRVPQITSASFAADESAMTTTKEVSERAYAHFTIDKTDKIVLAAKNAGKKSSLCPPPPIRLVDQMEGWPPEHVDSILSQLPRRGNLLIFGMDSSSPAWARTTNGKTIFLEKIKRNYKFTNNKKRRQQQQQQLCDENILKNVECYNIRYTTASSVGFDERALFRKPTNVWLREKWLAMTERRNNLPMIKLQGIQLDVIIISITRHQFATLQAIYTSYLLAKKKKKKNAVTHIFIRSYEEGSVIDKFAVSLFQKRPFIIVEHIHVDGTKKNTMRRLAHFVTGTED